MGSVGAGTNVVRAKGVKNYNALLQVRQVAEINQQIKELEENNIGGKYNSRIEALTAQKENVVNNFEKNFEEFAKDYLAQEENKTELKKQIMESVRQV